jgi:glycosyltransferase involved in cell wall biosynthesis
MTKPIPPTITIKQAIIELPSNGPRQGLLSENQVIVTVEDEAGGPYLVVSGISEYEGEEKSEFVISTREDIDALADALRFILDNAENVGNDAKADSDSQTD